MTRRRDIERRWGVYVRFSKEDEGTALDKLDHHEQLCRKHVDDRALAGVIVDVYVERSRSAWKPNVRRPEYERLIDDIKNGVITGVLCYKSDRLYRKLSDLEELITLVGVDDPPRVAIESVRSGTIDLSTADGRKTARILGAIAAGESDTTSERLRDHMTRKASKGLPTGGRRPFGYCDDKLTPHPIEAPIMRNVFERIARGETLTAVADKLNADGVRSSTGKPFTNVTVRQLVTNPRYNGRRTHNGVDVAKAAWPALVDNATFRRANALIEQRRGKRRAVRRYLLSGGLLRCGKCTAALVSRPHVSRAGDRVATYVCSKQHGGCGGVQVRAVNVERIVTQLVIEMIEGETFARELAARTTHDDAAALAVEAANAELASLFETRRAGGYSDAEYVAFRDAARERLAAASTALAAQSSSAAAGPYLGRPDALRSAWFDPDDPLTLDEQQAIVRSVIDHVDVLPTDRRTGRVFDPDRIVPHLVT